MNFPYYSLREFVDDLIAEDELIVIEEPVNSELEITEIADRISKDPKNNKALLFKNVVGYDIPVLINAMGSHKRMQMALGVADEPEGYDTLGNKIRSLIKPELPTSFGDKLSKLGELAQIRHAPPKKVSQAPCQEVVIYAEESHLHGKSDTKLLDKIPILKCWPDDGGKFITLTSVFTKDPDKLGGGRNVGMYRLQKFDDITTGMHWHKHHDGASNYQQSLKKAVDPKTGKTQNRMEIAVCIGNDPCIPYSATAPLPPKIDELLLAGWIRQKSVEVVKCKTIDIEVPASSEIVLEGYIDLNQKPVVEGPFGDHTGFYSLADYYPQFPLTAITHRRDPIYATTIVGIPPQEDCYLGKATERIFLPLLQLVCPEVLDMDLPWAGVFHNCALIKIKKRYPGHAFKVMNAIWGVGQLAWTKCVIVLDEDVDIHDYNLVTMHAFGNTDPERDMLFTKGPLDILDHASTRMGIGSKVGIDATKKWKEEGFERIWPDLIEMDAATKEMVDAKWDKYFG
jgi:4-hydroxy-3-polyprenylbenzoate decarboxylase